MSSFNWIGYKASSQVQLLLGRQAMEERLLTMYYHGKLLQNAEFTTARVPRTCPKRSDCFRFETDRRKLRDSCKRGMVIIHFLTICSYWQLFLYHKLQLQLLVTGFYYFHILEERARCERLEPNILLLLQAWLTQICSEAGLLNDLKKF